MLRYWSFVMITLTLTAFIGYGTFATARLLQRWTPDHNLLLHPLENLVRAALLLACVGLGYLSGLGFDQLGWQWDAVGQQLVWGLIFGFGLGLCFYLITQWLMRFVGKAFYSTVVIEHLVPRDNRELLLVLAAMAPVVILEELLFRSLLLGGLAPIVPTTLLVLGLSILFGLLHSPQGIWGMFGAGFAGYLFAVLFLWQGSLLLPIVAHYVTNAFQIIQAKRHLKHDDFFSQQNA